jgi:hypothetical protein
VVDAPAVERPETEHQLLKLERLREVVVGAELEPTGLVVQPGSPLPEATMRWAISSPLGPGMSRSRTATL